MALVLELLCVNHTVVFCSTNAQISLYLKEIWNTEWLFSSGYFIYYCSGFNLDKLCFIPINNVTPCLPRYFGMKVSHSIPTPLFYSNDQIANWQHTLLDRKLLSKSASSPVITKTFLSACVSIYVLSLLLLLLVFILSQIEVFCGAVSD